METVRKQRVRPQKGRGSMPDNQRSHRPTRLSYEAVHGHLHRAVSIGSSKRVSHTAVKWHELVEDAETPAREASLADKSSIVCRAGLLMLSGGTGGYRVRELMNAIADALGISCVVDLGLITLECTCIDGHETYSEVVTLATTGVNTERIALMVRFAQEACEKGGAWSVDEFHRRMDAVEHTPGNYAPWQVGLAAAFACAAFVFLLGGGPIEMLCAFVGAGVGNFVRRLMIDKHLTQFACIGVGVAAACLAYLGVLHALALAIPGALEHEAGYIGAMLFVIPGFPLITSGFDIAKLDLRSGIERAVYAVTVIAVATLVALMVAELVQLYPDDFSDLGLNPVALLILRAVASFVGVYGFSMLFNSPLAMAATAGVIGAVANTARLELVGLVGMPAAFAAFVGALIAGLLSTAVRHKLDFPRISLTVPSIVIMVPGLYLYRAVYCLGTLEILDALSWGTQALMIVLFLPIGLIAARILTDRRWRYCN